ncbi:MAG: hypothetical protein A3B30_02975 [Candidatus Komeilibacteria bacterium RIFCSPLOWO2_01_FULL_52_15]|uniref:Kazal-like domain-containing protein n=1 Tax=Candidatus Komeilibacteria bacterium RIFCSPLOWO2_01_FULL_52_15 TaxID=1798551 RepID=A0A1G2BTS9_9BACT|nr:MAG: hypothetical protein A3B30_02975 [Candidatus Komeilibacteria bacterium RIFCSPLOWO2_01_FULL_52_15]
MGSQKDFLPFMTRAALAMVFIVIALALQNQSTSPATRSQSGCTGSYRPVCGVNGLTYANSCEAAYAATQVLYDTPCPTPSKLTDAERHFLFWLLHRRQELNMPSVAIRHSSTEAGPCDSCTTYVYGWGTPAVSVRIVAKETAVLEAKDTENFDYLKNLKDEGISP